MSRTRRTEPDGTIVPDGKGHNGQLKHDDPWDVTPYNRSEAREQLSLEIMEYIRENEGALTSEIIDHILTRHQDLDGVGGSWLVCELLDQLKKEGKVQ